MYILPSKQESKVLFEATRTCVWLKLDVYSMRVKFATQQRDTSEALLGVNSDKRHGLEPAT